MYTAIIKAHSKCMLTIIGKLDMYMKSVLNLGYVKKQNILKIAVSIELCEKLQVNQCKLLSLGTQQQKKKQKRKPEREVLISFQFVAFLWLCMHLQFVILYPYKKFLNTEQVIQSLDKLQVPHNNHE